MTKRCLNPLGGNQTGKYHYLMEAMFQPIGAGKERLQLVIRNLLSNAIKYFPKADNILVEVEEKENVLQVSVKDYGVGMQKQYLDKIFKRYYRVQEHAAHFQGQGIGLYISNDIIKRHDGDMWVESETGIGSSFYSIITIQNE